MANVPLFAGLILFVVGIALGAWHLRRGEPFFAMEVNLAEGRFVGAPAIAFVIVGAGLMVAALFFGTRSLEAQIAEKDTTIETLRAQKDGAETARDLAIGEREAAVIARDAAVTARDHAISARDDAQESSRLAVDAEKRADEARTRAEAERDSANEALAKEREERREASARANLAEAKSARVDAAMADLERRFRDTVLLLQRLALSPGEVEAFTELRNEIASLNDRLEIISLHATADVLIEGRERWVTFSIARPDWGATSPDQYTLFEFEARQTTPVDPWGGPPSEQMIGALAANLCEAANRAIFSNVDFWDALAELSDELAEARSNPVIAELAESAYLRLLVAQKFTGAEMLIRGYADAADGDWLEPLDARPASVTVLPLRDPASSDAVFSEVPVEIPTGRETRSGRAFGNADLPNLRANAVARLIDRMTDRCRDRGAGLASIDVLEGSVVPRRDSAYRRVVGYLQVPMP
ncbi:hypothetical protein [Paracoccus sp. DMF]|uniref:hypothetical protein n=1 Tax=Paracoccus sp. DMF TaxID=400837 RepID=UPI0011048C00|nr:hypothetical protein [Paracoccus sp. DMF]MCV2449467.1 hypothetical protein [Paracoccus sp. DMF]